MSALSPRFSQLGRLLVSLVAAGALAAGVAGCRHRASATTATVVDAGPPYRFPDLSPPLFSLSMAADGQHGWAVGVGGAIVRTADGGRSWQRVEGVPCTVLLHGVAFSADGQTGCVVGDGGTLLRSIDGGQSWQAVGGAPPGISLRSVALSADGRRAWAAGTGGTLLASADAGLTWKLVAGITSETVLESIAFSPDGQSVWAAGDDGILVQSGDGGATWRAAPGIDAGEYLMAVAFPVAGPVGWTVGQNGALYQSRDGGRSWQRNPASLTTGYLNAVAFSADGRRGWAAGDYGIVLRTTDGGQHWSKSAAPTSENLYAVAFAADGKVGWVTGDGGTVLRSENGGETWVRVAGPVNEFTLTSVCFAADSRHGWAAGANGTLLQSGDGGGNWQVVAGLPADADPQAVTCSTEGRRAWAVGRNGLVLRTEDGGDHWRPVAGSPGGPFLRAVAFAADGQRGWAVGDGGTILATTDGGLTWLRHPGSPGAGDLDTVAVTADGERGWAAGDGGTILRTTNGGQTWAKVPGILTQRTLRAVAFAPDGLHGWAMGDQQTELLSVDGGQTWQTQMAEAAATAFNGVAFAADGRRGWAVGDDGLVLRSVDGGQYWWLVARDAPEGALHAVAASADGQSAWAVGNLGTIRVTSSAPADRRAFAGRIAQQVEVRDGMLVPTLTVAGLPTPAPILYVHLSLSGPNATGDLAKGFERYFIYGQPYAGWKADELGAGVYTVHAEVFDSWNVVSQDLQFGNGTWARLVSYMGWDIAFTQPVTFAKEHGTQNFALVIGVYVLAVLGLFALWPMGFVLWHEKTAPFLAALPFPTQATDKVAQLAGLFLITRPRALDAVVRRYAGAALAELGQRPEVAARPLWVAAPLQVEDQLFGSAQHPYEEPAGLPPGTIYIRGLAELKTHLVKRRWWLSIEGPGGVGKSALAFQLARWLAAAEAPGRAHLPQAIPLYVRSPQGGLDAEVLAELKRILELPKLSTSLSAALLSQRRVLAIVDGLSEKLTDLESLEQGAINPAKGAALTAFAVFTSRRRIQVPEVVKVLPGPVDLGTLDAVLNRYLEDVVGAGRFTPEQRETIRDALKAIMREIAGPHGAPSEIPMVFLKLLILRADVVLAANEAPGTPVPFEVRLPKDLSALVDAYLASLLEGRPDCVAQAGHARQAALACVGPEGLPSWRPLAAYAARAVTLEQLESLVTTGLVARDGADVGDPRYKFTLDPIADYLAAKELVLAVRDGKLAPAELKAQLARFAAGSDIAARVQQIARTLGVALA